MKFNDEIHWSSVIFNAMTLNVDHMKQAKKQDAAHEPECSHVR